MSSHILTKFSGKSVKFNSLMQKNRAQINTHTKKRNMPTPYPVETSRWYSGGQGVDTHLYDPRKLKQSSSRPHSTFCSKHSSMSSWKKGTINIIHTANNNCTVYPSEGKTKMKCSLMGGEQYIIEQCLRKTL